jgi:outer membrane protein assembly factor BamB
MIALMWLSLAAFASPTTLNHPPTPVWQVPLPGRLSKTANHAERSAPVDAPEGLLLGVDSDTGLFLVSRDDGRMIRRYSSDASVQGSAVVGPDKLFFADSAGGTYCYSHAGDLLWSHASGAPILSTPTVFGPMVYVTNVNDLTVAIHVETGSLEWQYQRPPDAGRVTELALFSAPTPLVLNGIVVTGYSDGSMVGLHAQTGDVVWDTQVGEGRYPDLIGTPSANQTDVFASGYFGPLVALDAKTQSLRWSHDAGSATSAALVDTDAGALIAHPGSDGTLRGLNVSTGELVWTWSSGNNGALTEPVITGAGLLMGATDGGLYLVNPASGEEVWRARYPFLLEGVTATPLVLGRDVYFVSNAGNLYKMTAFEDDKVSHTQSQGWTRLQR